MAALDKAGRLDLQPLDRRIDIAHGPAAGPLAQHVPGFERLAHFQCNAAMVDPAEQRKAKRAAYQSGEKS